MGQTVEKCFIALQIWQLKVFLQCEGRHKENIPPRLYLYTDSDRDRKNTNLKIHRSLMSFFLHHDMDEVVAARPAADDSNRNPVERCLCIVYLSLYPAGNHMFKVNNKDIRTTPVASFWCLYR